MIKYNYFGKEQEIYYEKLENGLEIYVIPNKNRKNYHVELVTKYGSHIEEFIPIGKKDYLKIPLGTAHFLEHKTFDMEDENVFAFYSKSGTYINAGTNYFCTRYYIDGQKNLKNNIEFLMKMVYTPFYKEDRIDGERQVITEEIKMYDDEPEWVLDYESKKSLYHHFLNEKIAGTVSSIKEINADILKKTYDTFYQPSNMMFIACGNVKYQEIVNLVKSNEAMNSRKTNYPIIFKKEKEPKAVVSEYKLLHDSVMVSKLCYSFKFDLDDYGFNYRVARLYFNAIFTFLFGESSEFNETVNKKKISTFFFLDHLSFDNSYTMSIEAESEYADLFKEEVDKTIKNIKITEKDFERIKKIWISILIRSLDHNEAIVSSVVDDLIKGESISDQYELINSLQYQDLLKIIDKIDTSNKSFILMVPKEK